MEYLKRVSEEEREGKTLLKRGDEGKEGLGCGRESESWGGLEGGERRAVRNKDSLKGSEKDGIWMG